MHSFDICVPTFLLNSKYISRIIKRSYKYDLAFKGDHLGEFGQIINFLFFAQKVSSGMGALRPKLLDGYRH